MEVLSSVLEPTVAQVATTGKHIVESFMAELIVPEGVTEDDLNAMTTSSSGCNDWDIQGGSW